MTAPSEWAKHLRPEGKRQYNKAERRAVKGILDEEDEVKGPGLTKDPEKMRRLRIEQGETVIPVGIYCYGRENCPYWDKAENEPEQNNGFCWFMGSGDFSDENGGLLWDQCKECGIREDESPEGTVEVFDERELV